MGGGGFWSGTQVRIFIFHPVCMLEAPQPPRWCGSVRRRYRGMSERVTGTIPTPIRPVLSPIT
jgi:hypothetical protein